MFEKLKRLFGQYILLPLLSLFCVNGHNVQFNERKYKKKAVVHFELLVTDTKHKIGNRKTTTQSLKIGNYKIYQGTTASGDFQLCERAAFLDTYEIVDMEKRLARKKARINAVYIDRRVVVMTPDNWVPLIYPGGQVLVRNHRKDGTEDRYSMTVTFFQDNYVEAND